MTVAQIMDASGFSEVDLLKLDIEGAEADLFRDGPPDWLKRVTNVAVELHDRFRPGCTERVLDALQGWNRTKHGEYDVFTRS